MKQVAVGMSPCEEEARHGGVTEAKNTHVEEGILISSGAPKAVKNRGVEGVKVGSGESGCDGGG